MFEFLNITEPGENLWMLIATLAIVTYLTRMGGHAIVSIFKTIPPRVHIALEAVPAAVISALVAPAMFSKGLAEFITLVLVAVACLRLPPVILPFAGLTVLVGLRNIGL